jgi:hypothetical protein
MKEITVSDMYQEYKYILSCEEWKNFDTEFNPELTPKEMLELWVFWGLYFWDKPNEFPDDWWEYAKLSPDKVSHKNLNFFDVEASQTLWIWREKWWIHNDDPRWWFQWYCRYYMWRRHDDDQRQIKRWKMMTRHIAQIKKNCLIEWDPTCRPKQRQALLHWAYDSRKM